MNQNLKDYYRQFTDILYAHFLWFVVSFLGILITFGASTTALFKVIHQVFKTDEPTHVTKTFFKAFKDDFMESTCVWFIILVILFPLIFMMHQAIQTDHIFLMIMSILAGYQLLLFFMYVFPIISQFKTDSVLQTIKNTLLMQNRYIFTNLKLIGTFGLIFLSVIYIYNGLLILVIASYGYFVAYHLRNVFKPFIEKYEINDIKGDDYEVFKF